MTAGLPGTGLGGLLYVVLALLMPLRELYLTARSRSSRERWALVARQAAMALAIVVVLVTTATAARRLLEADAGTGVAGRPVLASALVGGTVLVVLTVALRIWAALDRRSPSTA
jgi:hypothetical protein